MDEATALQRLQQIDHIVVLMMENRSFDHMLGYRRGVDGIADAAEGDERFVNHHQGTDYRPQPMKKRGETKVMDPGHNAWSVGQQMALGMKGFVANYASTRAYQDVDDVMRYQTAERVPVYDWLADQFAVLDRWFCSVPGGTWPNRLAALTGEALGRDNRMPPLYDRASLARGLDLDQWRWYSTDPGSLRLVDDRYRVGFEDNFASAEKPSLTRRRTFYTDVMEDDLPSVAWIDPNFVDLGGLGGANDDHPPTDVMAGQSFVLKLYQALSQSDAWRKCLFVITYDEHGGFFDHVDPRELPDDFTKRAEFKKFGPRVPAIVVSPFVDPGSVFGSPQGDPCLLFDHTSLIKTILLRFNDGDYSCLSEDAQKRVKSASHLGHVLRDSPRGLPAPRFEHERLKTVGAWWSEHIQQHLASPLASIPALSELGVPEKDLSPTTLAGDVMAEADKGFFGRIARALFGRATKGDREDVEKQRRRREAAATAEAARGAAPGAAVVETNEFAQGYAAAVRILRSRKENPLKPGQ